MSTGLASKKEIKEAVRIAKKNGCPKVILLNAQVPIRLALVTQI